MLEKKKFSDLSASNMRKETAESSPSYDILFGEFENNEEFKAC